MLTSKMSGLVTRRTDWKRCNRNGSNTGAPLDVFSDSFAEVVEMRYRDTFYSASDYEEMAKLGLNSVRIPIGCELLSSLAFLVDADDSYTLDRLDRRLANRG